MENEKPTLNQDNIRRIAREYALYKNYGVPHKESEAEIAHAEARNKMGQLYNMETELELLKLKNPEVDFKIQEDAIKAKEKEVELAKQNMQQKQKELEKAKATMNAKLEMFLSSPEFMEYFDIVNKKQMKRNEEKEKAAEQEKYEKQKKADQIVVSKYKDEIEKKTEIKDLMNKRREMLLKIRSLPETQKKIIEEIVQKERAIANYQKELAKLDKKTADYTQKYSETVDTIFKNRAEVTELKKKVQEMPEINGADFPDVLSYLEATFPYTEIKEGGIVKTNFDKTIDRATKKLEKNIERYTKTINEYTEEMNKINEKYKTEEVVKEENTSNEKTETEDINNENESHEDIVEAGTETRAIVDELMENDEKKNEPINNEESKKSQEKEKSTTKPKWWQFIKRFRNWRTARKQRALDEGKPELENEQKNNPMIEEILNESEPTVELDNTIELENVAEQENKVEPENSTKTEKGKEEKSSNPFFDSLRYKDVQQVFVDISQIKAEEAKKKANEQDKDDEER